MLENSISDGALYPYRFTDQGRPDIDGMLRILKSFWTAVSRVFDEAWEKPPRQSRLTHGLGILSLGFLMDAIAEQFEQIEPDSADFETHLQLIAPLCAWTGGSWKLGPYQRRWNDLQNTPRDVQVVADHLLSSVPPRAQADSEPPTSRPRGGKCLTSALRALAQRRAARSSGAVRLATVVWSLGAVASESVVREDEGVVGG